MRCWIMGSKRWGDTNETHWGVTWWGRPTREQDGELSPDTAPEYFDAFKTEAAAIKHAEKVAKDPRNYWGVATVCKRALEQIDGTTYDWEDVGTPCEVGGDR